MLKPIGLTHGHYECRALDETLPVFTDLLAMKIVARENGEAVVQHPNTGWRLVVHEAGPGAPDKPHNNHYGVRVFHRERNKWRASPFAEVLVGGSHVNNTVSGPGGLQYTDLGFSMKAGGGVDFNLSPHFAVRVLDADYYRTSLFGAHQNNIWLTTGFVIRLGGARPE